MLKSEKYLLKIGMRLLIRPDQPVLGRKGEGDRNRFSYKLEGGLVCRISVCEMARLIECRWDIMVLERSSLEKRSLAH